MRALAVAMTGMLLVACTSILPEPTPPTPSFPNSRGSTAWEAQDVELPPEFREGNAGFGTPDDLVQAFIDLADMFGHPAATVRAEGGLLGAPTATEAVGFVQFTAYRDDSLAGSEYRLQLRRGEAGWFIASVEEREHCRRGVAVDSDACL